METLNLFIRSIFIDNMVFAFFFGMCSYIAVSKSVKTALGLGAAVTFVMVMTVPLNYLLNEYVLKSQRAGRRDRPELLVLHRLHRHDRIVHAISGNGRREVLADALQSVGYLSAADRRELRHHGRFALHAAEGRRRCDRQRMAVDRLRSGFGHGLVARHRHDGRHSRKRPLIRTSPPHSKGPASPLSSRV